MNSIIPDDITEIGDAAFYGCSLLTDISLPKSVTKIGKSAFYESGLTRIIISKQVNSIGACAFSKCDNLTNVIISNSVKYIGDHAFSNFGYAPQKRNIYCMASKKPDEWSQSWIDDDSRVHWKGEWITTKTNSLN